MNAADRHRCIERFMSCKVFGPDWRLPPAPIPVNSNCIPRRSQRIRRALTAFGQTKSLAQWARDTGVPENTIDARLRRHWSVEDAVSKPVGGRGQR